MLSYRCARGTHERCDGWASDEESCSCHCHYAAFVAHARKAGVDMLTACMLMALMFAAGFIFAAGTVACH